MNSVRARPRGATWAISLYSAWRAARRRAPDRRAPGWGAGSRHTGRTARAGTGCARRRRAPAKRRRRSPFQARRRCRLPAMRWGRDALAIAAPQMHARLIDHFPGRVRRRRAQAGGQPGFTCRGQVGGIEINEIHVGGRMAASGQSVQVIPDQRPHRAGADAPVQPGRAGPRRAQPAHQRRVGADQGAQRVGAGSSITICYARPRPKAARRTAAARPRTAPGSTARIPRPAPTRPRPCRWRRCRTARARRRPGLRRS